MRKKQLKPDQVLFYENQELKEMYIIRSGSVCVYKTINGEKVELATLGKGKFIGEISLFLRRPSSAGIMAIEETELEAFTEQELFSLLQHRPKMAIGIIRELADRLRKADDLICELRGEKISLEIIYGLKK